MEEGNIIIKLATQADIAEIIALQSDNLIRASEYDPNNVPKDWYVSLETSQEDLERIIRENGIVVAKKWNMIVWYQIPLTIDHAWGFSWLESFVASVIAVSWDRVNEAIIEWQLCVRVWFRWEWIPKLMHEKFKKLLKSKWYTLIVTWNMDTNPRSIAIHKNLWFKIVAEEELVLGKKCYIVTHEI